MDLQIDTNSKNHIDAIVNKGKEDVWRLTRFYGEPITHKRFESWNLLQQLNNRFNLPGCVRGTLKSCKKVQKKGVEATEVRHRCSYSKKQWMNVVLLILDLWVLNLCGKNTSLMVIRFGRD